MFTYSVDVKQQVNFSYCSELRSCVKVEVAVLDSPSLTVPSVSVAVPGLPVPNSPSGLCGRR